MRLPSIALVLVFALAACGDDPSIVASWREVPNTLATEIPPVAERTVWTFGDDGTLTMLENGDSSTAAYTIDGDDLTLTVVEPGETLTIQVDVIVGEDQLLYGAIYPQSEVDGAVGTWRGDFTINGRASHTILTVRADQTVTQAQTVGTDPEVVWEGTWAESGDSLMFTFMPDAQTTLRMRSHRMDEKALGQKMEKILSGLAAAQNRARRACGRRRADRRRGRRCTGAGRPSRSGPGSAADRRPISRRFGTRRLNMVVPELVHARRAR